MIENDNSQTLLGERDSPLVFGGRSEELGELHEFFRPIRTRQSNNPTRGGLFLVSGIQGIGKTQMAKEFIKREVEAHEDVHMIEINVSSLKNHTVCYKDIRTEVSRFGKVASSAERLFGFKATLPVVGEVSFDKADDGLDFNARLKSLREKWGDRTLIVYVDEIQGIESEPKEAVDALGMLCSGTHGCPMMVLCSGLQNSHKVLAELGGHQLSRQARHIVLGALTTDETLDCIDESLREIGYTNPPQWWVEAICESTDGFPYHITTYLNAAIESVNKPHTDDTMFDVLVDGDTGRYEYYATRLGSLGLDYTEILRSPSVKEILGSESVSYDEMREAISHASELKEMKNLDPRDVIREASSKGIFTYDFKKGGITIEIPSLRDFILNGESERLRENYPNARSDRITR